ncbi:MAG TPA: T9SS type A sorting domain-containing protein, partial [Saprospiraceae bacterium]|nr:T9SS type A sorting domain-containing protein [Saprospiraceae bacterium]
IFNPEAELVNTQISHIDCNSSGKIKLEINSVASANMTYQWSDDNTVKNAQNINCSFIIEKEVPEAGSYTVTVTSNNHAYTFGPYNVVYSGNKLDLATNVKPACTKQANGEIELVFTNGNPTDINWSHDASLKSYIATGLPAGAYTINYTDNHGCIKTVNIEIGNKELPDQNNISVTPPDCNFDKGLIYVAVPESNGIASGTLLNSQNQVVATQNSALTFIFSNIASGNYTLLYSDEEGCTTTLNLYMPDKQIPQSKLLTSTITDNNKTVSAFLTQQGKAPFTYTWSDGFNGSVRSDLSAGKTYKVTVTDANGCTEILNLVIKPNSSDVVSGFTAFPVPADQYVMLRQCNPEQIDALTEIQVLDSSGKLYRIEKIREGEEIRLNTASLPNGLYFVHINSSNGEHILVLSVLH